MKFYTNVSIIGNSVLVREVVDGVPGLRKEQWKPTFYTKGKPRNETKELKTLDDIPVYSIQPGTIQECRDFLKQYEGISGFEIFGQLNYQLQYCNQYKPTGWVYSKIGVWGIDIETAAAEDDAGVESFPNPATVLGEILCITMIDMHTGQTFTFGSKPSTCTTSKYMNCNDEYNTLKQFLLFWEQKQPDIITGWNIRQFDIPYLINRITKILGTEPVKKLSPWGRVMCKSRNYQGREEFQPSIYGVSILDYIELYKKYTYVNQESYALQHIAQVELGHTKLSHDEYVDFTTFARENWNKFIDYNVIDTVLIKQLDDKLKLIELVLTLAYEAHTNYEDVASPVKLWDAITANYCLSEGVAVPQSSPGASQSLDGAYVKEPSIGWHKSVVSLDATSLYPSIIMTNNISPESYRGNCGMTFDDFMAGDTVPENINPNYTVTPVGAMYDRTKRGIFPILVEKYMARRKEAKTEMLRLEQEYENLCSEATQRGLSF